MSPSPALVLPPGPKLSLIDTLVYRPGRGNPLEFFHQIAKTYGDLASYRMAGELLFLVNDPALIKDVLERHRFRWCHAGALYATFVAHSNQRIVVSNTGVTLANRGRALLLGILALTMMVAVRGQAGTEVPARLLEAARFPPRAFADSLVDTFIPAGLEVQESRLGPPGPMPLFDLERQPTVPLSSVIETFNATHADYQATWADSVVVIRPVRKRLRYLDTASDFDVVTITDPMEAVRRVWARVEPTLVAPGGRLGSYMVSAEERRPDMKVTMVGSGHTVVETLNQIAAQIERGWVVYTSVDQDGAVHIDSIGLLFRRGGVVVDLARRPAG